MGRLAKAGSAERERFVRFELAKKGRTMTAIPSELVTAYLQTDFRVLEPQPFTLRVGFHSPELHQLYIEAGVPCAGYLTAWNPYSAETSVVENEKAQQSLIQTLSIEGYRTLKALGVDPSGDWPGEESIFVPGLDLNRARSLGIEFGQNAIVWAGDDAIPKLVLLR